MRTGTRVRATNRRRLLTGAGLAVLLGPGSVHAQTVAPSPTPTPIRIQTPDLAFADALNRARATWASANDAEDLILSVVPAEPASDSLLNDARSGARRFSGALVPNWLIPDLVRDDFILLAAPPVVPLPASVAQLRTFGGEWVATDLDHDCTLLYIRQDLLEQSSLDPAGTWPALLDQAQELLDRGMGSVGLPLTHAQQVIDHFVAMAAAFVLGPDPTASFWFDTETMSPAIAADAHQQALESWRTLGQFMPAELRAGSTGDLWQAFIDGRVSYLVASAGFLPFALDRGIDPGVVSIASLPGVTGDDGNIQRVGNVCGPSWGGVTMRSTGDSAESEVTGFLASLATPDIQRSFWTDRSTGITPAPATESDVATMGAALTDAGWPEQASAAWLIALHATFANPLQLPALRIAETRRYLQAMEDRIVPFLMSDGDSAAETLATVVLDWTVISEAIGVDTQRDLYLRSLTPAPTLSS